MIKNNLFVILIFIMVLPSFNSYGQCQYLDTLGIANLQDSLSTNFPAICKKVILGQSVLGREIVALKFSDNVQIDENEPEILFTGCIHGSESNPEQMLMKFSRKFCLEYASDPQIKDLIDNREIWIIAVANPDGLAGGRRGNANGVDLNRNYGYMWNAMDFGSFSHNYEPETKLINDFILSRNFNIMIDFHSGLQGIIYPWYYKTDNCPDYDEVRYLAEQYDVVSGYQAGEFAVTSGADLYVTNGALVEFAYGSLGIHAYGVELKDFFNGYSDCELVEINKPSIYMMLEKAGQGISGAITDATNGNPIQAKIHIQGKIPFYSSSANGDYHHFLKSGTYSISVSANGYEPQTKTINTVSGSLITEDFQLNEAINYSAQKIISCRNFNNVADPAETWNALGINDGNIYAIGDTGYVVLDMGLPVTNVAGNDITIHGNPSGIGNGFELFYSHSIYGPWTSLGVGSSNTSFDLDGAINARYFRVEDNGVGAGSILGAGFNLDAITAVEINVGVKNTISSNDISLYPNPTVDVINFSGDEIEKIQKISLFDNSGRLLLHNNFTNKLDLNDFSSGVYFVQLYDDKSTITFKIIKK